MGPVRFVPEDVVHLGERVFMRSRMSGHARANGIALHQTAFHIWTFRDEMSWRCEVVSDEKEARNAASIAS